MQVLEGACLSVLGTVEVDSSGELVMTKMVAVVAGGLHEVKKYLKMQIGHYTTSARLLAIISALSLSVAGYLGYLSHQNRKQEEELKGAIAALEQKRMPTAKAEEMGTQCLICYTNPSNVVLVPCNHLCICSECHDKQKADHNNGANAFGRPQAVQCPICRKNVDLEKQILIVY